MISKRRTYYLKRLTFSPPLEPLSPDNLAQRQLWLRPDLGVERMGRAAYFDPSLSQNLSHPDTAALTVDGQTAFWVACWVKLAAVPDTNGFIINQYDTGATDRSWALWVQSGTTAINARISPDGTLNNNAFFNNVYDLSLDTWHFVIFWYDPDNGAARLHVDAANQFTENYNLGVHDSSARLMLGARPSNGAPGNFFPGAIDQAAFGKPVGPIADVIADIEATLHNSGDGVAFASLTAQQKSDWGLVSFWELDEESGTRADRHGNHDLADTNGVASTEGRTRHPAVEADPVSHWFDPETGIEFAQGDPAKRPTYHLSPERLAFDGLDDRLEQTEPLLLTLDQWTLFLVAEIEANGVGSDRALFEEFGPDELLRVAHVAGSGPDSDKLRVTMRPNAAGVERSVTANPAVAGQGRVVIAVRREGTHLCVWLDGQEAGTLEIDPGVGSGGSENRLGGSGGSGANLDGAVAHVLTVEAALSAAEIAQVTAWFESESGS